MATHIGAGYGSEYHLTRYLARYRNEVNRIIGEEIGGTVTEWLNFLHGEPAKYDPCDAQRIQLPDTECTGISLLGCPAYSPIMRAWHEYWPQTGSQQQWDALGKARIRGQDTWLLVEAKAHTGETKGGTNAGDAAKAVIDAAFHQTQQAFGITTSNDWTKGYYQYANRLAALHFLRKHDVPARLLFLYFLGDKNQRLSSPNDVCPATEDEWRDCLDDQDRYLGLTDQIREKQGVHELFLEVAPRG